MLYYLGFYHTAFFYSFYADAGIVLNLFLNFYQTRLFFK